MGKFLQYYKAREANDPETNRPMNGNHPSAGMGSDMNVDNDMGYGQKRDPADVFESAVDAASNLLDALEKLNPLIPDENNTLDINKVTQQVQGIMDNLQALAARLDGSSPAAADNFESGETPESIA